MAINIDIEMEGATELAQKLKELPAKVAKIYMAEALREAAAPVLAQAQYRCPTKTMALLAGLHINVSSRGGETVASVSNDPQNYYAIMAERGAKYPTRTRRHGDIKGHSYGEAKVAAAGMHGKRQPAKPFMGPALEAAAEEALAIAAASLKGNIEGEMNE